MTSESSGSISFSRPNAESYSACFQRVLSFEEPHVRWQRLLSLAVKNVSGIVKSRDISQLPIWAQDHLFSQVFSGGDLTVATIINIALAYADFKRFTSIVFDSWYRSSPTIVPEALVEAFPSNVNDITIDDLAQRTNLSEAQWSWLQHERRATIDWATCMQIAADDDAKVSFFRHLFKLISSQLSNDGRARLNANDYLKGIEVFDQELKKWRARLPGSFLPYVILLAEGATEAIVLPHLARLCGVDFGAHGVLLISAGGAKPLLGRYLELKEIVSLPLVVVMDADAEEQSEILRDSLRDSDALHVWQAGEIEDTFETGVFFHQLNRFFSQSEILVDAQPSEFSSGKRRTAVLNSIYRRMGLGNFDKIGFAESLTRNLTDARDVPAELVAAINAVKSAASKWNESAR